MSKRRRQPDPFANFREWQDHRYDPGYFTGGRIHPILKGSRPNRYGYILLGFGLALVFVSGGFVRSGDTWSAILVMVSAIVEVAAGFALIRRKLRSTEGRKHGEHK